MSGAAPVPAAVRGLAERFTHDAGLCERLSDTRRRLQEANDRLCSGLHPDGLAAVYREHPAVAAESRSEALEAEDALAAEQQVHWQIHRAHLDYQDAVEERRQARGRRRRAHSRAGRGPDGRRVERAAGPQREDQLARAQDER